MNKQAKPEKFEFNFQAKPKPIFDNSKYRKDSQRKKNEDNSDNNISNIENKKPNNEKKDKSLLDDTRDDFINDSTMNNETAINVLEPLDIENIEKDIPLDFIIDKPKTPIYIPIPKGKNVETQINENDLFDYNLEVEPILQVLVGKSLENSRIELLEENETKKLIERKKNFEMERNAELMVTQRLERTHIRKIEEKERRVLQHKTMEQQNILTHKKFLSKILSKNVLANLKKNSMNFLSNVGFLEKNKKLLIRMEFINNWLENEKTINNAAEKLLFDIKNNALDAYREGKEKEMERRRKIEEERIRILKEKEEEKKRKMEIKRLKKLSEDRKKILGNPYIDAFEMDIADIDGDGKKEPVVCVPGGFFLEIWLALNCFNNIYKITLKKKMDDEVFILAEKKAKEENLLNLRIYNYILTAIVELIFKYENLPQEKINELNEEEKELANARKKIVIGYDIPDRKQSEENAENLKENRENKENLIEGKEENEKKETNEEKIENEKKEQNEEKVENAEENQKEQDMDKPAEKNSEELAEKVEEKKEEKLQQENNNLEKPIENVENEEIIEKEGHFLL